MKIAVNARFLLENKLEGIGWFTHEIFRNMVLQHPEIEFVFFFDRPFSQKYIFSKNVRGIVVWPPARHPILWNIWFHLQIPRLLKKHKIDIFISPDGFASLRTSIPQICVIHDLAFEHFPEHLPFKFRYFLKYYTPKFIAKSKHVVTVSDFTKQDIIKQYGTSSNKISVVYNGAHDDYKKLDETVKTEIKNQYAQGKPYFVFAGALHPRKNIENLLEAFALFKQKNKNEMQLLIIGRYAWKSDAIKQKLEQHPFRNEIHVYDYMNVDKLSKIIGSAFALCFVSHFEGFGIPILEAIKCKVPCIVSNTSSMPEVAGNSAIYIQNPNNSQEIADAMLTMTENEPLRNELIVACASQALKFDWAQSAAVFFEIIKRNMHKVNNS